MSERKNNVLWIVVALAIGVPLVSCFLFCGLGSCLGTLTPAPPAPVAESRPAPVAAPQPAPSPVPSEVPGAPASDVAAAPEQPPPTPTPAGAPGPTRRQIQIAHEFNDELWENPDDDEDRVQRRVARRMRVTPQEVSEAYILVSSDERLRQEMIQAYNASHGFDRRGNRLR